MCREGQTRVPKVYIIAHPEFRGDKMAFTIKEMRASEDTEMSRPFSQKKGDFNTFDRLDRLIMDKDAYNALLIKENIERCEKMEAQRKLKRKLQRKKGTCFRDGTKTDPVDVEELEGKESSNPIDLD